MLEKRFLTFFLYKCIVDNKYFLYQFLLKISIQLGS